MVFRSLMIRIDQRIITERQETFSELIDGVLLCGSKHFERPYSERHLIEGR